MSVWFDPCYSISGIIITAKISKQTVYDEFNSGRLKSFKVGRRRFVSGEALATWIRTREAETQAADGT